MFCKNRKFGNVVAWVVTLCMAFSLLPVFSVEVQAQTVNWIVNNDPPSIGADVTTINLGHTGNGGGTTRTLNIPANRTITITGHGVFQSTAHLVLNIPATSVVNWEAGLYAINTTQVLRLTGAGTFNKNSGHIVNTNQGTANNGIALRVDDPVTVNVTGGILRRYGSPANSGTVTVSRGGTVNFYATPNFGGAGGNSIRIDNGTVNVNEDLTVSRGILVQGNGTLNISDGATLTNTGTITNQGTIRNLGELANTGTVSNTGTVENYGTITGNAIGGTVHDRTAITVQSVTANGTAVTTPTTQLTLNFSDDVPALTAGNITVTNTTWAARSVNVDSVTGTGATRTVNISGSWTQGDVAEVAISGVTGYVFSGTQEQRRVTLNGPEVIVDLGAVGGSAASGPGWHIVRYGELDPRVMVENGANIVITGNNQHTRTTINIASGGTATVTLRDAHVTANLGLDTGTERTRDSAIYIAGTSTTLNLILEETNTLRGSRAGAGIRVGVAGNTVNISGTGTLNATGGPTSGAGIGGRGEQDASAGTINIISGTIYATGGNHGAGIGSGGRVNASIAGGGTINISGGTVTATGGPGNGMGIGGGGTAGGNTPVSGTITIGAGAIVHAVNGNPDGRLLAIGHGTNNVGAVPSDAAGIPIPANITIHPDATVTQGGMPARRWNATVTGGGTLVSATGSAWPSETVTLGLARPGHILESITVSGTGIVQDSYNLTGRTVTFTMPTGTGDIDVTVTAVWGDEIINLAELPAGQARVVGGGQRFVVTGAGANNTRIDVRAGETATITLRDANITITDSGRAGIHVPAGAVLNLILEGNSTIHGNNNVGAINALGTVNISGTGTLNAIGGTSGLNDNGAGIRAAGTVTITSGTIIASGGQHSPGIRVPGGGTLNIEYGTVTATAAGNAAGIGGSVNNNAANSLTNTGTINISGGTVTATGSGRGSGIGGGGSYVAGDVGGAGGTINISGGTVTATATGTGAGIGGGGSGGGTGGASGTITIGGTAIVNAVNNATGVPIGHGRNNIGNAPAGDPVIRINQDADDNATVYQNGALMRRWNATVTGGGTLVSATGSVLVGGTVTIGLTNPGYALTSIAVSGEGIGVTTPNLDNRTISFTMPSGTDPLAVTVTAEWYRVIVDLAAISYPAGGSGWSLNANGAIVVNNGASIVVTGIGPDDRRIDVAPGATATITLDNAHITATGTRNAGIWIPANSTLNLYLEGVNTVRGSAYAAAIQTQGGTDATPTTGRGRVIINGPGTLNAFGGDRAPGIGGNGVTGSLSAEITGRSGGVIIINSGTVNATGGANGGAGIGGGGADGWMTGGRSGFITIYGGTVTANGTGNGAGIGGGGSGPMSSANGGAVNTISITGGNVTATGGTGNGAGIGGGGGTTAANNGGAGGTVTIGGDAVVIANNGHSDPNRRYAIGSGTNNAGNAPATGTTNVQINPEPADRAIVRQNGTLTHALSRTWNATVAVGTLTDTTGTAMLTNRVTLTLNRRTGYILQSIAVSGEGIEQTAVIPNLAARTISFVMPIGEGNLAVTVTPVWEYLHGAINLDDVNPGDEGTGWRMLTGGAIIVDGGANLIFTGAGQPNTRINLAPDATANVTLRNANISATGSNGGIYIPDGATLHLYLEGVNTIQGGGAGIHTHAPGGIITINSGTVNATGHTSGAGIGGGTNRPGGTLSGAGGTITITGGTVNATGALSGAGIGGGGGAAGGTGGAGGTINITGGTVTATGLAHGAAIGGGGGGTGGGGVSGTISIGGDAVVYAVNTHAGGNLIGHGFGNNRAIPAGAGDPDIRINPNAGDNAQVTLNGASPPRWNATVTGDGTLAAATGFTTVGDTVTLALDPRPGYSLSSITVSGVSVDSYNLPDRTVTFTMPGGFGNLAVTVTTEWGDEIIDLSLLPAGQPRVVGGGQRFVVTGTGENNTRIDVAEGETATITLRDANIVVPGFGLAGIHVPAGSVLNLILVGNSTVGGGNTVGAINAVGTVNISGTGTLNAIGGAVNGPGIRVPGGGTLNIENGIIIATGSYSAAGIGGNANGSATASPTNTGTINISGGTVNATGGTRGAGIGGGGGSSPGIMGGAGGTINITGGTVTATGGDGHGAGIGGGGSGGGPGGASGAITIGGDAVVNAVNGRIGGGGIAIGHGSNDAGAVPAVATNLSINPLPADRATVTKNGIAVRLWSATVTDGELVPGAGFAAVGDRVSLVLAARAGNVLTSIAVAGTGIDQDAVTFNSLTRTVTFTMPAGTGNLAVTVTPVWQQLGGAIDISTLNPGDYGDGWHMHASRAIILSGGADITLTGIGATNTRIDVAGGETATVTLHNVYITAPYDGRAGIWIPANSTLNLNLEGVNTIRGGSGAAAIQTQGGTNSVVNTDRGRVIIGGDGTLNAYGGDRAPGIGGNGAAGTTTALVSGRSGGVIIINSGTVNATGGGGGNGTAGIGGGGSSTVGQVGGRSGFITINGGTVTATGAGNGAGIGGGGSNTGTGGEVNTISIMGGNVTARGGAGNGAGIGGGGTGGAGTGGAGGTITIGGDAVVHAYNGHANLDHGYAIGRGVRDDRTAIGTTTVRINPAPTDFARVYKNGTPYTAPVGRTWIANVVGEGTLAASTGTIRVGEQVTIALNELRGHTLTTLTVTGEGIDPVDINLATRTATFTLPAGDGDLAVTVTPSWGEVVVDLATTNPPAAGIGWHMDDSRAIVVSDGANIVVTGEGSPNTRIDVAGGGTATITLRNAYIPEPDPGRAGIWIPGNTTLNLYLEGVNTVRGGNNSAAVQTAGGATNAARGTVIIDGTGTLNAYGGGNGAGIGGRGTGGDGMSGFVIINGGTVNATAGVGGNAAGIGGGVFGSGGEGAHVITITGGTVTATGSGNGAGIGGGGSSGTVVGGYGGTIRITGGNVTATSGNGNGAAIGGGGSLGTGANSGGAAGTITIGGDAVVAANNGNHPERTNAIGHGTNAAGEVRVVAPNVNINPEPTDDARVTKNGIIASGPTRTWNATVTGYGTLTAYTGEAFIGGHATLTLNVRPRHVLTAINVTGTGIEQATVLRNLANRTVTFIMPDGDTPLNVTVTPTWQLQEELVDLATTNPGDPGIGWHMHANRALIVHNGADIVVTGEGEVNTRIDLRANETVTITLRDVTIAAPTGGTTWAGIWIPGGATLHLYLEGVNTIHGASAAAAIRTHANGTVIIGGTGTLNAYGGNNSAGIGGNPREPGGTIIINSGTVNATAGNRAAGIGGGAGDGNNVQSGAGGTITITGGTVNATGRGNAAGIGGGGGHSGGIGGAGGTINITGGNVTATAVGHAAAIGGGGGGAGGGGVSGTITIGGTATVNAVNTNAGGNTIGHGFGNNRAIPEGAGDPDIRINQNPGDNATVTHNGHVSRTWSATVTTDGTLLTTTGSAFPGQTVTLELAPMPGNILTAIEVRGAGIVAVDYDLAARTATFTMPVGAGNLAVTVTPEWGGSITNLSVTVAAPAVGAAPVTQVTNEQWTAAIAWTHAGGNAGATFGAMRAYTANVTITPAAGFTLVGVAANSFTINNFTTVHPANTGVFTFSFPSTGAATITNLNVGIAPPEYLDPPVTLVTNPQWTAAVTWTHPGGDASATFGPERVYTASVTITPAAGFTLTGVAANSFTVNGLATTHAANTGTFTFAFPATGATPAAPITNLNVAIAAPVFGGTPVREVTNAQWTATVDWTHPGGNAGATFGAARVYTARVSIIPAPGFTFTGVAANSFTVNNQATTHAANTGTFIVAFPATAAAPITNLNVTIPAPALDGIPVTEVTNPQWTAAITWTHPGGDAGVTFGEARVYTASVTITPAAGFTLTGVAANSFTVNNQAATHAANTGAFTFAFPATGAAAVFIAPEAITGVTSPVANQTPSTAINNGTGFTASLSWNGDPAAFGYATAYTATVTLTAQGDYIFPATLNNTAAIAGFTVSGYAPVWVSRNLTQLVFTVTFTETEARLAEVTGFIVTERAQSDGLEVQLLQSGTALPFAPAFEVTSGKGITFTFSEVPAGTYSIAITMPGHTNFTINNVTVGDTADVDLRNDPRPAVQRIELVAGDITGSGTVTQQDLDIVMNLVGTELATSSDPNAPLADLDGNGWVTVSDMFIVINNMGSGAVVVN